MSGVAISEAILMLRRDFVRDRIVGLIGLKRWNRIEVLMPNRDAVDRAMRREIGKRKIDVDGWLRRVSKDAEAEYPSTPILEAGDLAGDKWNL